MKKIFIFLMGTLILISLNKNVKASTPITNLNLNNIYNYYIDNSTTQLQTNINQTEKNNIINCLNYLIDKDDVKNYINNYINQYNLSADELATMTYYNFSNKFELLFYIPTNTAYYLKLVKDGTDYRYYIGQDIRETYKIVKIIFSNINNLNYTLEVTNNYAPTIEMATQFTTNNGNIIVDNFRELKANKRIYHNNTLYYVQNYIDITLQPQQIENNLSENGYMWSPSTPSGDVQVNKLYTANNQNIDCDVYVGNNLTLTKSFYYLNNGVKQDITQYVSNTTTQTTSGEWYKYYIEPQNLQYLPNNTNFYVDMTVSLNNNTETVIENFLAFHTVEIVIPTPTPQPTATPTPTPTPNIGTISNQINDINNNITNSKTEIIQNQNQNTDKIVEQLSGDSQKLIESITSVPDLSGENISSGDIREAVGIEEVQDVNYTAYSNFWYEMLTNFSTALTNINRQITIEFLNEEYIIDLDQRQFIYPQDITAILQIISTAIVAIYISKDCKHLIEDIQTASIDNVAAKLTEDFTTNIL